MTWLGKDLTLAMVLLFIIVLLWTSVIYFILWHMRFVFCLKILGKNTILVPTFCGHYSLLIWLLNLGSSQFGLCYFHLQSIWSLHFGNSQIDPCYFQFTVDLVIIIFKITVIFGYNYRFVLIAELIYTSTRVRDW